MSDIPSEKIDKLEKAESIEEIRSAFAELNLTQEDREYLASCGIV